MRIVIVQRYQRRAAATLFGRRGCDYSAAMKPSLIFAFSLVLSLAAGCASFAPGFPGSGLTRTFEAPIARVKPAFVTTLSQMGMQISAIEFRGKNEVLRARKGDRSAEIELERLSATSTRVRVTGNSEAAGQVMRETEKRLTQSNPRARNRSTMAQCAATPRASIASFSTILFEWQGQALFHICPSGHTPRNTITPGTRLRT
jgi:hypothetical protein